MTERPYHQLYASGELKRRVQILQERLRSCRVCPRHCDADRWNEIEGFCKSGRNPLVASSVAHFGEEPVLVGKHGAGNIFFASCNLRCVYCQNWQISHPPAGKRLHEVTCEELADKMIALQNQGCHNINFVSPSHFVAQMLEAIEIAVAKGLHVPLVYNTNAYDDLETLKLLDGVIDIYLPDLKYSDDLLGLKYSQARSYVEISRQAVQEMFRQVGLLETDEQGLAKRGLIVRHLILPHDLAGSESTLKFLAEEVSRYVNVSLMSQYYPTNKAEKISKLSRKINQAEYDFAVTMLEKYRLEEGYWQEFESSEVYRPDFNRERPFDNRELGLSIA